LHAILHRPLTQVHPVYK